MDQTLFRKHVIFYVFPQPIFKFPGKITYLRRIYCITHTVKDVIEAEENLEHVNNWTSLPPYACTLTTNGSTEFWRSPLNDCSQNFQNWVSGYLIKKSHVKWRWSTRKCPMSETKDLLCAAAAAANAKEIVQGLNDRYESVHCPGTNDPLHAATNVRRLCSVKNCPCKNMVIVGPYLTYHDHLV